MYNIIEVELRGVHQALQSSHAVFTVPPPSKEPDLGDEPTKLHKLAYVTKALLHRAQEEIEQATEALKQVKKVVIEQR
jgi:hypothetical protein